MKKILAIIGSPRKGETYNAVKRFEETLNEREKVEMEYVMLSQVGFSDCAGCHNCILKGRRFCKENQKVTELYDKMQAADAIILASPVYNQSVTAIMKKFLDYFTFLWHRPEMFGKKFFGISSGGGMFKDTFKMLKSNVKSWVGTWTGELGVPHYESLKPKFRKECDEDFGKKAALLISAIEDKNPQSPDFGQLMMFNIWKMNAVACKDSNPVDFAWWTDKNLFDKSFYYPVKIGFFKKLASGMATFFAKSFMRKVYVGYDEV